MADEVKEFFEKFKAGTEKMKKQAPDAVAGFSGLFSKVMKDGAISLREKELVALGIGLVQRCAPCIRLHVQRCLDAGATKTQILEAAGVAVMMGGGPAYTQIPILIDTLESLEAKS